MLATTVPLILLAQYAMAHGNHEQPGPAAGETVQQYAQRHMSSEHHIDSFDTRSFFQLHDLDRDGYWTRPEIEAVYGVHHIYSQKKSKDDVEHQKKADKIVDSVLLRIDLNKDGKISPEELENIGLDGLPNFDDLGAEGHHYDVESEFFLHHEEQFHSTPETQTDESYIHPEDLEHFAMHEEIELKEAEKEAKFQGSAAPSTPDNNKPPKPKYTRVTPPEKEEPSVKFKTAKSDAAKKDGYKPPTEASDKMRKNMPYKTRMQYKFRKNWGDF
ncbi:hypothetical protein BDQ17DRAFT_1397080 [Cyathus striatus]|nr:hypothetical protein BDQ17DRAFT_1397080 [Cyathus striatus]